MALLPLRPGAVVCYLEMCSPFGVNLQRGMNFRLRDNESLILMSVRPGAPYQDRVEEGGKVIVYEVTTSRAQKTVPTLSRWTNRSSSRKIG